MDEKNQSGDALILSAEHLGSDLMGLVLQEIKALPDMWQKTSEDKQRAVIDRVQRRVEDAVKQAVNLIAANGKTVVVADLVGVSIKAKVQAQLSVPTNTNAHDALLALYEARGKACLLVFASPEEFVGGMTGAHTPDPDQTSLELDTDSDTNTNTEVSVDDIEDGADGYYSIAVEHVRKTNRCSISGVQRKLRIGYNRAARLVELMEARGVITPMDAGGKHEVILAVELDHEQ